MEQTFLEQIFKTYNHLRGSGKCLSCFCKQEMDKLSTSINKERSLHEKIFALINTGTKASNGEHWMGVIINK